MEIFMSKDLGSLPQAAHLLTVVAQQRPTTEQIQVMLPYLSALAQAAAAGGLPSPDAFRAALGLEVAAAANELLPQFNPATFIGEGWRIEEDGVPIGIAEITSVGVRLETMLETDEEYITGEQWLVRLKEANAVRLGAAEFWYLWNNQGQISAAWKKKTKGNTTYVFFDGTVLRDPHGDRCTLCLYWDGSEWRWGVGWLGIDRSAGSPSAVLAS